MKSDGYWICIWCIGKNIDNKKKLHNWLVCENCPAIQLVAYWSQYINLPGKNNPPTVSHWNIVLCEYTSFLFSQWVNIGSVHKTNQY